MLDVASLHCTWGLVISHEVFSQHWRWPILGTCTWRTSIDLSIVSLECYYVTYKICLSECLTRRLSSEWKVVINSLHFIPARSHLYFSCACCPRIAVKISYNQENIYLFNITSKSLSSTTPLLSSPELLRCRTLLLQQISLASVKTNLHNVMLVMQCLGVESVALFLVKSTNDGYHLLANCSNFCLHLLQPSGIQL